YIIFAKKGSKPVEQAPSPEPITVKGTVVDKNGTPLIGVSLVVEGTTLSTATDTEGNFTLTTDRGTMLSVSYVGYHGQRIRVANTALLQIVLDEDTIVLVDVVVTALGIKKEEKALAYHIQQLQAAEVLKVGDANFINSLAGKVAGVTINSSSAGIGGSSKVIMRGTKSIAGNNNALYVIDGIPMPTLQSGQPEDLFTGMGQSGDGLSNINPDDIESLSILSGPAAAALYGSDAANGVVLITTKKGQADRVSVQVSNSTLFLSPFMMPEFQNTYGSETGSYYSWGDRLATPSTYDPADFFRTGYNVFNSISLSTGTDKNQTYVSASALTAEGIIPNNTVSRYNVGIRNTSRFLNDRLNLDVSAMYISVQEQNMLAQGQYFNPLIPVYLFPRADHIDKYKTFERYNVERNFKTQYWPYGNMGVGMQNPYWIINRDIFENDKNRYMMSGGLKYDIADWINVTGRVKMDVNRTDHRRKYYASTDGIFAGKYGAYYEGNQNTKQLYADLMVNINKYIGDFSLSAILGTSASDVQHSYDYLGGDLMSVANLFSLRNLNVSQFEVGDDILSYHDQLQGVFGTAQVGYKSMAYLDITARNDWTNALSNTKTKSIFYPSVGLSAVVTEIFGIRSSVLSFLKARISYSEVGNAPPRYITTPTYELVNGYPQTTTFLFNENLQPERTKSWETGLNVVLWDKKIKLDVTLYKSSTENQLFNPTLSSSSGFSSFYVNAGKIENKGIELSLEINQPVGPVQWKSNLIYSLNRNRIVQLLPSYTAPNGETVSLNELNMGGTASYRMMLLEGGSMGDFYVNTLKTDEHGYIIVDQSAQTVSSDANTFIYGGNVNPLYNIGFRNSFEWNGISVGFMLNARVGGEVISITQALMDAYGVSATTAKARDNGGATVNGARIPAKEYYQVIGGGTSGVGAMYVYSATNVRLGELSIGYEVPVTKLVPAIKSLNVSFIGRNLFMIYNKAPFDPELTASTGTYYQGVDYFMPPSLRNIGFAVNIRF
ncbi:MAG: SusC/RagA family TonB-linked outer membrane protein, partial [Prevotellaceae bacterium]|nr:SusC/RagA family TonB-linked outer membrane protein [Prevotellaceae bacterium]